MISERTYVITEEEGELLDLRLTRTDTMVYLNHNGGTKAFDIPTAMKLRAALMAILSGSFDRAISETALRLEAERESRSTGASSAPTLDNL